MLPPASLGSARTSCRIRCRSILPVFTTFVTLPFGSYWGMLNDRHNSRFQVAQLHILILDNCISRFQSSGIQGAISHFAPFIIQFFLYNIIASSVLSSYPNCTPRQGHICWSSVWPSSPQGSSRSSEIVLVGIEFPHQHR